MTKQSPTQQGGGEVFANLEVDGAPVTDANPVPIKEAGTTIAQNPTIDTALYAANDNVGGLLTFANAARNAGEGGVISNMLIVDDDQEDAELELWLFNQTFTQGNDQAPFDPSDADMENWVGTISTASGTYFDTANQGACEVDLTLRYDLVGTSLFGRLVTRDGPTWTAATDLTVKICMVVD